MAKKNNIKKLNTATTPRQIHLYGVTNFEKLKNVNTKSFNQYNPFVENTFSKKAKQSHEAESLDLRYLDEDIYNQMLMMNQQFSNTRTGNRLSYYSMSRKQKRTQLQRMSIHDLVDDVLTKLCDEIVVTSENESAIKLHIDKVKLESLDLKADFVKELVSTAKSEFNRIVKMMGLEAEGTETSLWNRLYLFLTEGTQAYENVWDNIDNPKKIIAIHEIDALETEKFYSNGVQYWKHHKLLARDEPYIILYDNQVTYVDWAVASPNNRSSYLEHLIKPFNDLRIMDESLITWTLTNSVYRMLVKVPTKSKSRNQIAQSLATEKNRYHDDISYDGLTGSVSVNGSANLQMMKTYWLSNGDAGTPEIETVKNDGTDLNDTEKNQYFQQRFYRNAKMPYSRFDNSGSTWNIDPRSQLREEINFGRFCSRIRSIFGMIVLKPLMLQLVAKFPQLRSETDILKCFSLKWNSYNVFEELMELDIINEKIDAVNKIMDNMKRHTPDGEELPYWSIRFLMNKFVKEFSDEDFEENEKMRELETIESFKHQIKVYKMRAKYDPELNLDNETGVPNTDEVVTNIENDDIDGSLDILGKNSDLDDLEKEDVENIKAKDDDSTESEKEAEKTNGGVESIKNNDTQEVDKYAEKSDLDKKDNSNK